jgi:hypothetical protein
MTKKRKPTHPEVSIIHDTSEAVPEQGVMFMHCRRCLAEQQALRDVVSPKDYARQQVAFTETGFQVWCNRHNINIDTIEFKRFVVRAKSK